VAFHDLGFLWWLLIEASKLFGLVECFFSFVIVFISFTLFVFRVFLLLNLFRLRISFDVEVFLLLEASHPIKALCLAWLNAFSPL